MFSNRYHCIQLNIYIHITASMSLALPTFTLFYIICLYLYACIFAFFLSFEATSAIEFGTVMVSLTSMCVSLKSHKITLTLIFQI